MSMNHWRLRATTIATAGLMVTGMGSALAAPLPEPECNPTSEGGERCLASEERITQRTTPGDVTVIVNKSRSEHSLTDADGETLAEGETKWSGVTVLRGEEVQVGHVTASETSEVAGNECRSHTNTTVAREELRQAHATERCR